MKPRQVIEALLLVVLLAGGVALMKEGAYGLTVFAVLPTLIGGLASGVARPATGKRAAGLGALATLVASCGLLGAGIEGWLCIAMSLPLSLPLGALGGYLLYLVSSRGAEVSGMTVFLLLPLASVSWDNKVAPAVFEVRSAIEIAAPPAQVWKHVVTFSQLPEPQEWFFRVGLAYPKRARIEGHGVGAVRYCEFSTGPFVEPIEVWDEPRLLRFRVTANPAPLHEWSPYADLLPKHLHGYLVSKHGQFRLTPSGKNRTLLEGTTWYQHGLQPSFYWRWWSDAIIHQIHLRVLSHIKSLAEDAHQTY